MNHENIQFSKEELSRYNRHIIIPEFGLDAQKKLKAAKVLVIGSGGLGSPALLYLAAAGAPSVLLIMMWWKIATFIARYYLVLMRWACQKLKLQNSGFKA